ncbi:uncharacterized protein LOC136025872 [Artemia franciscana]|uniref:uncharacterized protein LOC136025872 n=1 Tax=Artemia franciscana TaxID=6661 RepID=UPI0032DA1782
MASNDRIWRRFALSSTWPFSKTGHERQMRSHRKEDGSVDWKRPLCGPEQNYTISFVVQDRLHCYCISNCQDPFAFLPANVVEKILSFLDCKSLARPQGVCRLW